MKEDWKEEGLWLIRGTKQRESAVEEPGLVGDARSWIKRPRSARTVSRPRGEQGRLAGTRGDFEPRESGELEFFAEERQDFCRGFFNFLSAGEGLDHRGNDSVDVSCLLLLAFGLDPVGEVD